MNARDLFELEQFEQEMDTLYNKLKTFLLPMTYDIQTRKPIIATPILFAAPSILDPLHHFLTKELSVEGLEAGLKLKRIWETFNLAPHKDHAERSARRQKAQEAMQGVAQYCLENLNLDEEAKKDISTNLEKDKTTGKETAKKPSMFQKTIEKHISELLEDDPIERFKHARKTDSDIKHSDYLSLIAVDADIQHVLTAIQHYRATFQAQRDYVHHLAEQHHKKNKQQLKMFDDMLKHFEHELPPSSTLKHLESELIKIQSSLSITTINDARSALKALRDTNSAKLTSIKTYLPVEKQALDNLKQTLSPFTRESKQFEEAELSTTAFVGTVMTKQAHRSSRKKTINKEEKISTHQPSTKTNTTAAAKRRDSHVGHGQHLLSSGGALKRMPSSDNLSSAISSALGKSGKKKTPGQGL